MRNTSKCSFKCILALIALVGLFGFTRACSCARQHRQEMFCNAAFAMRFVVKKVEPMHQNNNYMNGWQQQTGQMICLYINVQNSPDFDSVHSRDILHTAASESLCGLELEQRKKYFVTGYVSHGKMRISLCGWAQEWKAIPKRQRRLIKNGYNKSCGKCKVKTCFGCQRRKPRSLRDTCIWDRTSPYADCYEQFALCKTKQASSNHQRCRWSYGRRKQGRHQNEFQKCYKEAFP